AVARQCGDAVTIARALNNLAVVATQRGDLAAARAMAMEGLELAVPAGGAGPQGLPQSKLARLRLAGWEFARAPGAGARALRLGERLDLPDHEARPLHVLGQLAYAEERYDDAMTLLERCLARWRVVGFREGIAACLATIGRVAARQGDCERAQRALATAIR